MEYQPPTPPPPPTEPPAPGKTSMGMEQNVEAALSYLCCWLTGLVFFLLEKENNFVRFHAMQSIIAFGALFVIGIGLQIVEVGLRLVGIPLVWLFGTAVHVVLSLVALAMFLICIINAFQGNRFHLPVVGEMAEKYAKQ